MKYNAAREGMEDILVFEKLYNELVDRYLKLDLGMDNEFYYDYIDESALLPSFIRRQKTMVHSSNRRPMINMWIDSLCSMENILYNLEN